MYNYLNNLFFLEVETKSPNSFGTFWWLKYVHQSTKMNYPIHFEVVQLGSSPNDKSSSKIKGNNKTVKCQIGFFLNLVPSVLFPWFWFLQRKYWNFNEKQQLWILIAGCSAISRYPICKYIQKLILEIQFLLHEDSLKRIKYE